MASIQFSISVLLVCVNLAFAQEESDEAITKRNSFLQQQFQKFTSVKFEKETNGMAKIHRLSTKESLFEYEGKRFWGFKFRVPETIDSHFEWFFVFDKTLAQKDFTTQDLSWYIVPEHGRMDGFRTFQRRAVSSYPPLQARFPYTGNFITQTLDGESLTPGKTYAIWIASTEKQFPDLAFSIFISSKQGYREFGVPILELRDGRTVETAIREIDDGIRLIRPIRPIRGEQQAKHGLDVLFPLALSF